MASKFVSSDNEIHPLLTEAWSDDYRVSVPDEIVYCLHDLDIEIDESLEAIKSNEGSVVAGLVRLENRRKLGKAKQHCEKLRREYLKKWMQLFQKQENMELKRKYTDKISDYLQRKLKARCSLRNQNERYRKLGDVLLYYLMRGEQPNKDAHEIISRLSFPLFDQTNRQYTYTWYELTCQMIRHNEETFDQISYRLNNNANTLEYLLYKHPQLLFNKESHLLLEMLAENFPHNNLHRVLTNIRDGAGQTDIFSVGEWHKVRIYAKVYTSEIEDMYELLSIKDNAGRTALHVNTTCVAKLLADTYTPLQRGPFIELTSIRDINNQSALEVAESSGFYLSTLIDRVANNHYITDTRWDTKVLFIYNTKNRPGAEEEAQTVFGACITKYEEKHIIVKRDQRANEIISCIEEVASSSTFLGPPKALIVILASRGSNGRIHDCDGYPIELSAIEDAMCSDVLNGKSKVLITQCCQLGDASQETTPYVPTHDHFCAVMSCLSGEASNRGVFLTKLSKQIRDSCKDTNIFQLVNRVSREMKSESCNQSPILMSTLKAEYCPADWYTCSRTGDELCWFAQIYD